MMDCVTEPAFTFYPQQVFADGELELIPPDAIWIDAILRECAEAKTRQLDPRLAQTTRQQLLEFLHAAPGGRVAGDARRSQVPAYHFWMRWRDETTGRYRMGGGIGLRIGSTPDLQLYAGHVGYHVYPPARGRHFAERACRLLQPVLKHHGVSPVWITCNPDNLPSRRTCERLGATYIETVDVPMSHPFFSRGETKKCRYRWEI